MSAQIRRRPGHGTRYGLALDMSACPERGPDDEGLPERHGYHLRPPSAALCVLCGRATARRDADGAAWCGGEPPAHPEKESQA